MPPKDENRDLVFTPRLLDDLTAWIRTEPRTALRVLALVEAVQREPFGGIGKPEPLRHDRAGLWSRRVTEEHRLVYQVLDERILFLSCRYHYR